MTSHTKSLISALVIAFLDNFGYSIVFILFAPLVLNPEYGFFSGAVSVGVKNLWLGVLVGIFPFFLFFGAPFWGDVGDLWGRKRALVITILGTVLGHLLTAVAIFFESFAFLLIARAISGFLSGNVSICLATISDVSTDTKTKGRNFGLLTVFFGMGWILAMLVGGYLSDPTVFRFFNPSVPFYLAAGLVFLGYLVVQFLFVETHKPRKDVHFDLIKSVHDIKAALRMHDTRPVLYILLMWSFGWYFTFQWFTPVSLEIYHVSQQTVSTHLVFLGACWIIGGVLLNPLLIKRFSSRTLSIYSILFVALFIFLCSISSQFWLFSLFFSLSALSAPIGLSNIFNILSSSAHSDIQGKVMGFAQSFQALAGVVIPFAGGALANISINTIYPLSGFLLLISCWLLLRQKK
jgi:DHA1 family tetracycline resistance protein-like MFS transporter